MRCTRAQTSGRGDQGESLSTNSTSMVPFSMTASKLPSANGRSSMSATLHSIAPMPCSSTLILNSSLRATCFDTPCISAVPDCSVRDFEVCSATQFKCQNLLVLTHLKLYGGPLSGKLKPCGQAIVYPPCKALLGHMLEIPRKRWPCSMLSQHQAFRVRRTKAREGNVKHLVSRALPHALDDSR